METTVNIQIDIFNRITSEARARKISRSKMVILLLEMTMKKPAPPRLGRLVQYQESRSPEEWHTFHITFLDDEYEYFQDLRKLLKMSVSLLLALAVKKFLDDPAVSIDTDNYLFKSYLIVKEIVDSISCWRLYWGYPPGIREHLIKTTF